MIYVIKFYARFYEIVKKYLKINLPGLGVLYRLLKKDDYFLVKGKKLFFNHKISDNYGMLINGNFNEKETHLFLDKVFDNRNIENFHFIDIGGNIGEFVIDYSDHERVKNLTVFEPQKEQCITIKKTIEANNFKNTVLIEQPVSNESKLVNFNFNVTNSTASGIINIDNIDNIEASILSTTIDQNFFNNSSETFVMLIDIEGQELNAIRGGKNFIKNELPLIIFEYNHVTKKYFKIQDMQNQLGDIYKIYRLNSFGRMDLNFNNTWNLVALPQNKTFKYLSNLIDN